MMETILILQLDYLTNKGTNYVLYVSLQPNSDNIYVFALLWVWLVKYGCKFLLL